MNTPRSQTTPTSAQTWLERVSLPSDSLLAATTCAGDCSSIVTAPSFPTPLRDLSFTKADAQGRVTISTTDFVLTCCAYLESGKWKIGVSKAELTIHWGTANPWYNEPVWGGNVFCSNIATDVLPSLVTYGPNPTGDWAFVAATEEHEHVHMNTIRTIATSKFGDVLAYIASNQPNKYCPPDELSAVTSYKNSVESIVRVKWRTETLNAVNAGRDADCLLAWGVGGYVNGGLITALKAQAANPGGCPQP